MFEILLVMYLLILLTVVIGLARGTLSVGVILCMVLGLVVPGLSLVAFVLVIVKTSRGTRRMHRTLERMAAQANPAVAERDRAVERRGQRMFWIVVLAAIVGLAYFGGQHADNAPVSQQDAHAVLQHELEALKSNP